VKNCPLSWVLLFAAVLTHSLPADTNHWSFQPVVRPTVPSVGRSGNPVDRFIQARLAEQKLRPSPEADRHTLIRRLSFDLTGLPPSPEEVTAFERDTRADAYEQLVERLLNSPRFGERWARHWLDAVRYAETHGFEMNNPRPNAWPYRDYVIRAFNEDKPYDQFVREQIAGDVLGADEATGFLVAGAWDQVKSPDEVLTKNQRADELHDIVSVTGSAFLGLTVGCARCHDHKFDPVPMRDYYALKAVFAGVQHGDRARRAPDEAAREQELAARRRRLAAIDAALVEFEPLAQVGAVDTNRLRAPVHPRLNVERFAPVSAKRLRFTINATSGGEPCLDELEVFTAGLTPTNVALAGFGTKATASGTYPNSEIHRLEHVIDGRYGNGRSWISHEAGKGWVELEFPDVVTLQRVVWARDREEKYGDRLATDYRIEVAAADGAWRTVASSADRRPFQSGQRWQPDYSTNRLSASRRAELERQLSARRDREERIRELTQRPMVYAGEFKMPEPTQRLHRGDPMAPREEVMPGTLTKIALRPAGVTELPGASDFPLRTSHFGPGSPTSAPSEEQQRRLTLANWITDPANPLTARVIVNRLWQHHFGEGLVSTPSDFGVNGARPTHPELLDWLAAELMSHGWSLKRIHRLIVTSATYRQASESGKSEAESRKAEPTDRPSLRTSDFALPASVDAGNRLLWRYPSRRLEAEAIRDTMLAVAGRLDLRMGGPGWSPFVPNENYVRVYAPKDKFEPGDFRRMIYATVVRQRPDGVFGAFDCPDGGQVAPRRSRSTTPLQALNLLNSGFVMQVAEMFGERLRRESGDDVAAQVERGFQLAFQRAPAREELAAGADFARERGLAAFCRALLNANEFVFVF
jgi:hypothetical protein